MDFPTLSKVPTYPLNETRENNKISASMEAGYKVSRPRFTRTRRTFIVTYEGLTSTDKDTLDDFYEDDCNGGVSLFNWTHPESSVVYPVVFAKQIAYSITSLNYYKATLELEEP